MVYDPWFAIEAISSLSETDKSEAIKNLKYVTPKCQWNSEQYNRFCEALISDTTRENIFIRQTEVIGWIAQKFSCDMHNSVRKWFKEVADCGDIRVQYEVAQKLRLLYPDESARLFLEIADQSKGHNMEYFLRSTAIVHNAISFENGDERVDKKFPKALKALWEDLHGEAAVKIDVRLLASYLSDVSENNKKLFQAVAEIGNVKSENGIKILVKAVNENPKIDDNIKSEFIYELLLNCINDGILVQPETVNLAPGGKNRIRLFLKLEKKLSLQAREELIDKAFRQTEQLGTMDQSGAICLSFIPRQSMQQQNTKTVLCCYAQ
jgi:hypothetical protein